MASSTSDSTDSDMSDWFLINSNGDIITRQDSAVGVISDLPPVQNKDTAEIDNVTTETAESSERREIKEETPQIILPEVKTTTSTEDVQSITNVDNIKKKEMPEEYKEEAKAEIVPSDSLSETKVKAELVENAVPGGDSSSDISLIDEAESVTVRTQKWAKEVSNFVVGPTVLPSFSEKNESTIPKISTSTCGVQTMKRKRTHPRKEQSYTVKYVELLHYRLKQRQLETFCLMLLVSFTVVSAILLGLNIREQDKVLTVVQHIEVIQNQVLACLGRQQLQVMLSNDTRKRLHLVCTNEMQEYREKIEEHFALGEVQSFLFSTQGELYSMKTSRSLHFMAENVSHIDVELLIRQLEYYELLPKVSSKEFFQDLEDRSSINPIVEAELTFKKYQQLEANLTQLIHQLQDVISVNEEFSKAEREKHGFIVNDQNWKLNILQDSVDEKMNQLHKQYLELQNSINHMTEEKEQQELPDSGKDSDTVDADLKSKFASIQQQILELRNIQESTFTNVKHLYDVFLDTEDGNTDQSSFGNGGERWSFENLKTNMKAYINEAQKDITDTVNEYKKEVADTVNVYMKDGKKHAEETLNVVTNYFKLAEKETRNMIKGKIPSNIVNGIWNIWDNVQGKWANVKEDFKDMTCHAQGDGKNDCPCRGNPNGGANQKAERVVMDDVKNAKEEGYRGTEWVFKRANLREQNRGKSDKINWYLAREKLRARQRKRNAQRK